MTRAEMDAAIADALKCDINQVFPWHELAFIAGMRAAADKAHQRMMQEKYEHAGDDDYDYEREIAVRIAEEIALSLRAAADELEKGK